MIKLTSEDIDVKVKEDNPIYPYLRLLEGKNVFVGENISFDDETEKISQEIKTEEKQKEVTLPNKDILNEFRNVFSEDFLGTSSGKILTSHFENNLSFSGQTSYVELNNNLLKSKNKDFYLWYEG